MTAVTIEDEIYELLRALLSSLPSEAALLTRQRSSDPVGGEDIELTPTNIDSARIVFHPMGDIIYAALGRNTSMEFFVNSKEQEKQALCELQKISQAVVEGKFSEDVWTIDHKRVKSVGMLEIDGKAQKIGGSVNLFNPFRRKQKQHFDYSPYVQPGSDQVGEPSRSGR